jgi:hypothetical protein
VLEHPALASWLKANTTEAFERLLNREKSERRRRSFARGKAHAGELLL